MAQRLAAALPARLIAEQPDWARLDAFYADPAGHGWQMELEFLDQRAQLLAADASPLVGRALDGERFLVRPVGGLCPGVAAGGATAGVPRAADEQLRRDVVRPKLIVLLDAPAEELAGPRARAAAARANSDLTAEQLDRIRQAVREQARQPDVGPVLRLAAPTPTPPSPRCWPPCGEWSRLRRCEDGSVAQMRIGDVCHGAASAAADAD